MRGIRRKGGRAGRLAGSGGQHGAIPVAGAVTGGRASPDAVMVMPLAQVIVGPVIQPGYVTVGYRGLVPMWAPDGETIPATSRGRWGQVVMAGRP